MKILLASLLSPITSQDLVLLQVRGDVEVFDSIATPLLKV